MKYVLLDSGFLFAYFDEKGYYHQNTKLYGYLTNNHQEYYLSAVLFEVLNTRFMKNLNTLKEFERKILNRPNTELYQYAECKDLAKEQLKERYHGKCISLADGVLRYILKRERRIHVFVTNNPKDFLDLLGKNTELIDIRRKCKH